MRKARAFLCVMTSVGLLLGNAPSVVAGTLTFDATEQHYLDAYTLVRQAFEDKTQGRADVAAQKFKTARNYLGEIQSQNPDWHSDTVQFLLADCDKQLKVLEKTSTPSSSISQQRVHNLTEEMLYAIQKTRLQKAGLSDDAPRGRESDYSSSYRTSNVPSISQELSESSSRRRMEVPEEQPLPVRRVAKRPVVSEEISPYTQPARRGQDRQMLAEKAEALEAGFISQKKETEQWKLQYSILEEKSKEEIRALSSEFAKEKSDFESQMGELSKKLEKAAAVEAEKKKQEEVLFSVKKELAQNQDNIKTLTEEKNKQEEMIRKTTQRVEELERALQEAQRIRSKAEEDIKVREGQITLRMQQDLEKKTQDLQDQFEANKKQLESETQKQISTKDQQITQLQKDIAERKLEIEQVKKQFKNETSKKISELNADTKKQLADKVAAVQQLEQKLVGLVKDNASQETKIQELQTQLAAAQRESKEFAGNLKNTAAEGAELTKFKTQAETKIQELQTQLAAAQRENNEFANNLKNATARDAELTKIKKQAEALDSKNKQLEENLKNTVESKNDAQRTCAQLNEKIVLLEQVNKKLNEEKTYFLEQEKKFAAEKLNLEQQVAALVKQQSKIEEDLNRARYESAEKEGNIRNILNQTEAKAEQVKSENEKTVMGLIESFKQEKAKWRDEIAKLETQVGVQKKEVPATAQVDELKKSFASLQEENRSLQADKTTLQNQIKILESKVQGTTFAGEEINRKQGEIKELSDRLTKKEEEIKGRISQWESDKKRVEELGKLLENSEGEKKDLYVEINRLTEAVTQMKVDLKRSEETNNQLRETLKTAQVTGPASVEPAPVPVFSFSNQENKGLSEEKLEKLLENIREKMQAGKTEEALGFLQQQIKLYPQSDRLHFYKGLIFSRMNDLEQAKEAYLTALTLNPKLDKAYNNLGNLYSKQGKFAEAIENLKKATEINPNLSEAYNNMGIVYCNLGQFDEAIRSFIRATELSPNLAAAYYNLGQIYYQDGKVDAAKASFEKVIAIQPAHVEAKKYLQQIAAGVPANRGNPKIQVVQESETTK